MADIHPLRLAVAFVAALFVSLVMTPGVPTALAATRFPSADEALARPRVVVKAGTISTQYRVVSPPPDATYDLRGLTSKAYPASTTYPLSFGKDVPGRRTVVVGGSVKGRADPAATWQTLKNTADGTALLMIGYDSMTSYDLHASNVFDMFRPRPPGGDLNAASFLIEGCHGADIRDDAIENDDEMSGTVRGCVFDGVNSGVSIGQNATNPSAVTTIEDSTFIFRPMPNTRAPDGVGHAVLFKQMGGGRVVMRNDRVCYEETPIGADRLTNWMPGTYENVTIVLGPGFDGDGDGDVSDLDHPGRLPPGVTQTRDWSLCSASVPASPTLPSSPSVPPSPRPLVPPAITGMLPFAAPVGAAVGISGSGFAGASEVDFNGTAAAVTVTSDTRIIATVPDGATTGPVSVVSAGGKFVSATRFVVVAALSYSPSADALLFHANPTKNRGASTTLHLGQKPAKETLLKFDVSGIGKRSVLSAWLLLYCIRGSRSGGTFFPAANTAWNESTVTWRTAPAAGHNAISSVGAISPNTWLEVDLTNVVRMDGRYTVRVTSSATRGAEYVSKEGDADFRPKLIVTVA